MVLLFSYLFIGNTTANETIVMILVVFTVVGDNYLRYSHSAPQSRLYLSEVYDAGDAHNLQHAVPVVGLAELVVLLRTPRVRARTPAGMYRVCYGRNAVV